MNAPQQTLVMKRPGLAGEDEEKHVMPYRKEGQVKAPQQTQVRKRPGLAGEDEEQQVMPIERERWKETATHFHHGERHWGQMGNFGTQSEREQTQDQILPKTLTFPISASTQMHQGPTNLSLFYLT